MPAAVVIGVLKVTGRLGNQAHMYKRTNDKATRRQSPFTGSVAFRISNVYDKLFDKNVMYILNRCL